MRRRVHIRFRSGINDRDAYVTPTAPHHGRFVWQMVRPARLHIYGARVRSQPSEHPREVIYISAPIDGGVIHVERDACGEDRQCGRGENRFDEDGGEGGIRERCDRGG